MKYHLLTACIIQSQILQASEEVYYKKFVRSSSGNCEIIEDTTVPQYSGLKDKNHVEILKKAAISPVYDANLKFPNSDEIIETYSMSSEASQRNLNDLCSKTSAVEIFENDIDEQTYEVRKIVDSGDPKNRIDVVIMGDGYTANEREKFFDDLARLIRDMFEGVTFKSWLPLFNIWGIHVNSVDSGIGYDGPKNTPFKLYREKGQLRGILPGDPKNARAKCKLTGSNACDYPSILANDDFYGGLGGEFVISTRSERTGTVVLRHEMGHNFVYVGEEYDNGWVYSGVNASPSLKKIKWEKWLSGPLREEREIFRLLEYPWHDLSKGPKSFNFTSDGKYSRWYLLTSVSAAGEADSLEFILDGKALPWESRGSDDREFYDWRGSSGLTAGQHTFTVRSKTASTNKQIPRMIASVTLHEYGNDNEFNISNDYISAYPTWDVYHNKTYRPTSEGCLMRNMTSQSFCKVCKEGLWRQFLKRISLIDDVEVKNGKATVSPIKLGQLRPADKQIPGEKLRIRWYKSGKLISKFNDQLTIRVSPGKWKVKVKLISPEVRSDPKRFLTSTKHFKVKHRFSHIWIKIKSYIYPF